MIAGDRCVVSGPSPSTFTRAIAWHRSQTTDLIWDDPTGFRLAPDIMALLDWPFEVFIISE
jgi:hypothetical protein